MVRGRTGEVRAAEVLHALRRGHHRRGHLNRPSRPGAVVEIFVPLVPQRVDGERQRLIGREGGDSRVAPEAQGGVHPGHVDRRGAAIDGEQLSGQGVFGAAAVGRRAEPQVSPCPRPRRGIRRVEHAVGVSFFVGDERPVWRGRAVDARFPSRLPEVFVAAQEGEVDAGRPRGLDGVALSARPVLVVPDGHEDLRLGCARQRAAVAIGVDASLVFDVEPVGFQPARHRVFGVEHIVRRAVSAALAARRERPVVTHLVAARRASQIQAVPPVLVVGLPRRIAGLQHDIGLRRIVADHEWNVTRAAVVGPDQPGDVDAGDGGCRHVPRSGDGPVAAVVEGGGGVGETRGLVLPRDSGNRRDFSRAVSLIVAEPINIDREARGGGRHFEGDRSALVHADIGRKPLNRGVARSGDVPFRPGVARQLVLSRNRIARLGRDARPRDLQPEGDREENRGEADRQASDTRAVHRCHVFSPAVGSAHWAQALGELTLCACNRRTSRAPAFTARHVRSARRRSTHGKSGRYVDLAMAHGAGDPRPETPARGQEDQRGSDFSRAGGRRSAHHRGRIGFGEEQLRRRHAAGVSHPDVGAGAGAGWIF